MENVLARCVRTVSQPGNIEMSSSNNNYECSVICDASVDNGPVATDRAHRQANNGPVCVVVASARSGAKDADSLLPGSSLHVFGRQPSHCFISQLGSSLVLPPLIDIKVQLKHHRRHRIQKDPLNIEWHILKFVFSILLMWVCKQNDRNSLFVDLCICLVLVLIDRTCICIECRQIWVNRTNRTQTACSLCVGKVWPFLLAKWRCPKEWDITGGNLWWPHCSEPIFAFQPAVASLVCVWHK